MQHSKLAPSSAARRVACPGSRALEEKYPETEETTAAREGHAAHWVAQQFLNGVEDLPEFAPNGEPVTDEMIEGAELYVAEIYSYPALEMHIEERVNVFGVHPDCWGTPDCWIFDGENLHIFDYKFGYGYVDVFENWQLLEYALGVAHEREFKKVTLTIVQPRCYTREGKIRSWSVTYEKLFNYYLPMLKKAEAKAMESDAQCSPSSECFHCRGRHACDALQKTVARGFDVVTDYISTELTAAQTGVELRYLHRMAKLLEARITGLEEQAKAMIARGESVTGFKLEPGMTREKWTADASEIVTMGELMGLDLAKPLESVTPAQARKLGVPEEVLKIYSQKVSGKTKLVEVNAEKIFNSY